MDDIKTVRNLESTFTPSMIGDKYQVSGVEGDSRYSTKEAGFGIVFKIGDKVYDQSKGMSHIVVHTITDKYYDEACDIAIIELDDDYTVSAECISFAKEE